MSFHDRALATLSGSKKGGSSSPTNTADTLFANDMVEVLLGISEGPIEGLEDGAKSFRIGDTPLRAVSGQDNFENFELSVYKGSELGETIKPRLGGFASSTSVNTKLAANVPVVRSGLKTQLDFLDVRLVINQLVRSNSKGTFEHTGEVKIEYKLESDLEWKPIPNTTRSPTPPSTVTPEKEVHYGGGQGNIIVSGTVGDRTTFWQSSQPSNTGGKRAIWFDSSDNQKPKLFNGVEWSTPANLVSIPGGYSWSEDPTWGGGRTTKVTIGSNNPGTLFLLAKSQGNYWLNQSDNRVYMHNGSTWIIGGSSFNPGSFGAPVNATIADGHVTIKGKTTSAYPKELRIPVERKNEGYMLRVTRITPENTTENFFDVTWESFQEVVAKDYKFPALAATQLVARGSDQFSSIPDFGGIYKGRIVRVPSNYNPVARTYAGVWDGTWKLAYTNNVAYVTYDLVMNDRYGMNAYYPIVLNKWDVYAAGQWCDVRTANGRPRFTYNGLISDPRGGRDAINYLCGIFAGRFFDDGNGTGVIKIDRDDSASVIFTPENVVDGLFTYSFTEISTRHNDVTVVFTNPALNWQEDRRHVFDGPHIAEYGRIPHNFVAAGCTNEAEAIVRARYHLITGIRENRMVNFKTNRMGLYLSPYDVVLVADEEMGAGLSGRVKSVSGARTIQLREGLHLEPGFSYRIKFQLISAATDDFVIEARDLMPTTGSLSSLTTTEDLPPLPEDAVFTIEQINGDAAPVAFRVLSIREIDGDPDNVDIQAIIMHRAKWLFIDGIVDEIGLPDESDMTSKKRPEPVGEVRASATENKLNGRSVFDLALDWDPSPSKVVSRYKILFSRNNDSVSTLTETTSRQFNWTDVPAGEYVFQVIAIDVYGNESFPVTFEHRFIGDYRAVEPTVGLRMVDEPFATVFESRSPKFEWGNSTSADHESYVVQVRDLADAVVREYPTKGNSFQYEYAQNAADNNGTGRRAFKIAVASKDQYGFLSPFQTLTVTNPAPAAPTYVNARQAGVGSVLIDTSTPTERDFAAVVVHASKQQGFTPTEATKVYEGTSTNISLLPGTAGTYYYLVGFSDYFETVALNYHAEVSVVVPEIVDDTPPAIPQGLVLSSVIDGKGRVKLIADWDPNTEADFTFYDIRIKEGNGNWIGFQTSVPHHEWDVLPNADFRANVRAHDNGGNRSDYSADVTHTTVKDTTAPATPTGVVATGGIGAIWVQFARNTEPDFHFYEIVEKPTPTTPADNTFGAFATFTETFVRSGLPNIAMTRNIWVRAVDTSGNRSPWSARVQVQTTVVDANLTTAKLQGLIDSTSFAAGLMGVGIGETLPVAPFTATTPKTFYLTTEKRNYIQKTDGTGWIAETDASLIVGQLVAGQISAGAIGADQIAANAIRAKHMLLTDWENLLPNGDYADTDISNYWTPATNGGSVQIITDPAQARTGNKFLRLTRAVGVTVIDLKERIPVGSAQTLHLETAVKGQVADDGCIVRVRWLKADLSNASTPQTDFIPLTQQFSAAWASVSGQVTAPIDASYFYLQLVNHPSNAGAYWDFDKFVVRKADSAKLLVDGSIRSNHLTTGELITLAAQIKDALITNAKIVDLSAAKLMAGTALAGSITVSGRAIGSVANTDVLFDDMTRDWEPVYVTPGPINYTNGPTNTVTGSRSLVFNGGKVTWAVGPDKIAFDPSKLYRITFRIRREQTGDAATFYLGLAGVAEDGTTLVNTQGNNGYPSQHYWAANNVSQATIPTTLTEYVAYVKGHASPTSGAGTLASPGKMHSLVRYVKPMAIFNYDIVSGGGVFVLDSFKMEQVTEEAASIINAGTTTILPGKITISGGTTLQDWRGTSDTTTINGGKIEADSITARSLKLGNTTNIVDNGWSVGTLAGWTTIAQQEFYKESSTHDASGWIFKSNARDQAYSKEIAVTPGEVFHLSAWVYNAAAESANLFLFCKNHQGTIVAWAQAATTTVKNAWTRMQGKVVVPTNTVTVQMLLQTDRAATGGASTWWSKPSMVRAYGGELIVDGTIDTVHLKADSIGAAQIKSDSMEARHLKAGSITADKMAIGTGKNMLRNTEFTAGWKDWGLWNQNGVPNRNFALRALGDDWALYSQRYTAEMNQLDGDQNGSVMQMNTQAFGKTDHLMVIAGRRYEAYAYVGVHRCPVIVGITWYDSSGAGISESWSGASNYQAGGRNISGYQQLGVIATAPANAARATLCVRKYKTDAGQTSSYVFIVRPYFGEAGANQTQFSPWDAGGLTMINGDQIDTGSINASHIAAGTITASHISAGKINATQILQNGTTITDLIAANAVTQGAAAFSAGGGSVGAGASAVALTISISNPTGSPITIAADCMGYAYVQSTANSGTKNSTTTITLTRNGVGLRSRAVTATASSTTNQAVTASREDFFSLSFADDSPGAGTITYDLVISANSAAAFQTNQVYQMFLSALVRKR